MEEKIESLQNERIKKVVKLKEKKYRDEENLFIVEGDHLVKEAYISNQLVEIFALDSFQSDMDIKTTLVSDKVMEKLTSMKSYSNVLGVCRKFNPLTYGKRILLLDSIQDPGNLGTIIRSASAFYFDTVVLSNTTVDLYNDKVIRASEGMIFHIDVLRKDFNTFLEELKQNNYTIYGTNVKNGTILENIDFPEKSAILIGNEGNGLTEHSKSYIEENIYIPMNQKVESLNAGVASSIIMYEMSKKFYE